jgi:hypothetical protein
VHHAAEATEQDTSGRNEREPVAGDAGVTKQLLGNLDCCIAAEQRASDGFAGGEHKPAIFVVPMQPALCAEINEFRAEEGTRQCGNVNQHEPGIAFRDARPKREADENTCEHQPAVGSGVRSWHHEHEQSSKPA